MGQALVSTSLVVLRSLGVLFPIGGDCELKPSWLRLPRVGLVSTRFCTWLKVFPSDSGFTLQ